MLKDEQNGGAIYHITYVGDSVVRLNKAGTFQNGTAAYVEEDVAAQARAIGEFKIRGPIVQVGAEASPPPAATSSPPVKAAEPAPAPKAEVKAEAPKAEEKKADEAKSDKKPEEKKVEAKKDELSTTQSKRKGPGKKDEKSESKSDEADDASAADAPK